MLAPFKIKQLKQQITINELLNPAASLRGCLLLVLFFVLLSLSRFSGRRLLRHRLLHMFSDREKHEKSDNYKWIILIEALRGLPNTNEVYQFKDASSFTVNTRQSATRNVSDVKKKKNEKKLSKCITKRNNVFKCETYQILDTLRTRILFKLLKCYK